MRRHEVADRKVSAATEHPTSVAPCGLVDLGPIDVPQGLYDTHARHNESARVRGECWGVARGTGYSGRKGDGRVCVGGGASQCHMS